MLIIGTSEIMIFNLISLFIYRTDITSNSFQNFESYRMILSMIVQF